MTNHRHRRGMMLLEALVTLVVLGIALNITALLLLAAMRTDQLTAATIGRITRTTQLADQFRADVASSTTAEVSGEWPGNSTSLTLKQAGNRIVVYRAVDDRIERVNSGGEMQQRQPIELGPASARVEFEIQGTLVILRITEKHKINVPGLSLEIAATLAGGRP